MRSFRDAKGEPWEAAIGRESWGSFVILFSPGSGGEARKTPLGSESMLEAQQELDTLSDHELRNRLASSQPWQ